MNKGRDLSSTTTQTCNDGRGLSAFFWGLKFNFKNVITMIDGNNYGAFVISSATSKSSCYDTRIYIVATIGGEACWAGIEMP